MQKNSEQLPLTGIPGLRPCSTTLTMELLSALLLLLVPLLSSCAAFLLPFDCSDIYKQDTTRPSGVYTIYPLGPLSGLQVFCDMSSLGGQWTVLQRRMDGSVNFYRPWAYYKLGFGNVAGEYWLGLGNIFLLSHKKKMELLVIMENFEGQTVYARYRRFSVGPESLGYPLHVSGFIDGGAGDSLTYHSGHKFSTFDMDMDSYLLNCAKLFLGGFWYNNCHRTNPNGVYRWGADSTINSVGVDWYTWKGHNYSLKAISFMMRPAQ
ncbi:microfibril-associated glycoprotein 4-like [Poeciliopsis prolifica]|uniref:microfibril-associated glycoprotein 4-like n=1 Tax=Poeciliopsis prolifica TaxID=188132 RepID=UPI002413CC19|nr:microfibril-associated glycoprotein 4-like [Poeciliopsis prolifica]